MTHLAVRNTASEALIVLTGAALLTLAMAGMGNLALRIEPQVNVSAGLSATAQERVDKSASASLFGQFRSSMADFLWLKVDKYAHSGVDLRGLTDGEKKSKAADQVASKDGGKEQGNREHRGDETTVVPSANNDWRGIYGSLEREIQPYQNMAHHTHRDPKEALPLFRLMTWSNPHFIPGYTVGAAMIARDHAKVDDAITFLREGLTNNPDSIEIPSDLGAMLTTRKHDYAQALPLLKLSIDNARRRDKSTLSEDEKEAYQDAYRWTVLNRREAKDLVAARAAAEMGLKLFANDVVCRHYLESIGVKVKPVKPESATATTAATAS